MGLAEKRKAEAIKTEKLPQFESQLNEAAGYPINVEIDWNSFTAFDEYPLTRLENFVFSDVLGFVKKICSDDMGKEALQDAMTTIHIKNTDQDSEYNVELKDKCLYLTEQLTGGAFSNHRTDMLVKFIEPKL